MKSYTLRMDIGVHTPEALFNAAVKHATDVDGLEKPEAFEMLMPDGKIDVEACLTMILDPGFIQGCEIFETNCEHNP
jgi:hypothetical protein